jgi:hypothetical protein
MKRSAFLLLLALAVSGPGCVIRRFQVTSDPMGAEVYVNGLQFGPTPVDVYFLYYGKYHLLLVKDGFEPLEIDANMETPWYEYPGLDFVSENLNPCKLRDVHRFHYKLTPLVLPRPEDVRHRADELRGRGQSIGPPRPLVVPGGPPPAPPPQQQLPAPTPARPELINAPLVPSSAPSAAPPRP